MDSNKNALVQAMGAAPAQPTVGATPIQRALREAPRIGSGPFHGVRIVDAHERRFVVRFSDDLLGRHRDGGDLDASDFGRPGRDDRRRPSAFVRS